MGKSVFTLAFLFARLISFGQNDTLILDGVYQGKNIYIQTSANCVVNVFVNENIYPDTVFGNAFEINLTHFKFNPGDPVHINIIHQKDCGVKLLNPDNGNPFPTVEYLGISIDSSGLLKWETKNEIGRFVFIVEQFLWNKWVKVGEVDGKGGNEKHEYTFRIFPVSGENKFRVKQFRYGSTARSSEIVRFTSNVDPVNVKSYTFQTQIEFSAETRYELYDYAGNLVKVGFGKTIDCSKIERGHYYLNYDNRMAEIDKI